MSDNALSSINDFRDSVGLKRAISGQGSFRGVSFLIFNEQKESGGRRIVKREYPLRDTGGVNDLGRRLRERTFSVCVLGKDAQAQAEALKEALDAAGAGELAHPDFGTVSVMVDTWEYRRKADELNYGEFTITVYPAVTDNAPELRQNTASAVSVQKDALFGSLGDTLGNAWEPLREGTADAGAVLDAVTGVVDDIYDAVENLGVLQDVNSLLSSLAALKGSVAGLLNQPAMLGANVLGALSGLSDIADPSLAFSTFSRLGTHLQARRHSLDTRHKSAAAVNNIMALFHVATSAAAVSQASAASGILTQAIDAGNQPLSAPRAPELSADTSRSSSVSAPASDSQLSTITPANWTVTLLSEDGSDRPSRHPQFESVTDIERVTAALGAQLDAVALAAANSGFSTDSSGIARMRLLVVNDLSRRGLRLPGVVTVRTLRTEPALVTLYRTTGNGTQWQRLARRNGVINPLFVPGGVEIEIIDG